MPYPYFPEPRGFVGRPLLALLFAVAIGCLLACVQIGLPLEIAAWVTVLLRRVPFEPAQKVEVIYCAAMVTL
jgi:hypothetical protein